MSPLLVALLAVTTPAGNDWFYPGPGDQVALLSRDGDQLLLGDLPVWRTGRLLAHVRDASVVDALRAVPGVGEVVVRPGSGHVVRIAPSPGVDELALSRALHGRDGIAWVHPDFAMELTPFGLPNDPFFGDQWHLRNMGVRGFAPGIDINAELAWTRSTGAGGLVAIIDTGVDGTHPDLKVKLGHDYVSGDDDASPDFNGDKDGAPHGTACAGTAAAVGDNGIGVSGVARAASVYGIRLIGGRTSLDDFYAAFIEAVDNGAWVLSNSWGYGDKCNAVPNLGLYDDAMAYAESEGRGGLGAAVVFAAGNGNCDISTNELLAHPEVITVAATSGDDLKEGYSSFGAHVDVAAPSGTILTTDVSGKPGYGDWKGDNNYTGFFSGTSAATPVVSGVLLLMFAANERLTAAQARAVLCETAAKVDLANGKYDDKGWSPFYGCGRIDAGAAVMAVANTLPSAPVIVAPTAQAWKERVLLQWKPAVDADGDWLSYRVTWKVVGTDQERTVDVPRGQTFLDITADVKINQGVTFTVEAIDRWGAGAPSAPATFAVVDHPVLPMVMDDQGCACGLSARRPGTGGAAGAALLLGALLPLVALVRRGGRRRQPSSR